MRSCIYCGRELEKGEVCNCPQSVARRNAKNSAEENTQTNEKYTNPYKTETSYKTGYAGKESRFERAKTRYKTKKAAKKTAAKKASNINPKGFIRNLFSYIVTFLKSPTDKISNPGTLGKGTILMIAAIQGIVLWLCMFFILRGGSVGPFKLIASLMSFNGIEGYKLVSTILLIIISGAVSGIILFILYAGIFYLINRFIMRNSAAFWDFSIRLISAWIPFTVICAIGAILSMLSPIMLLVFILCGAASVCVLTYEALKIEWISQSPGKVIYTMMLGYFIFFNIVCHLLLI